MADEKSDDIVSLEDLLRDDAAPAAPSSDASSAPAAAPNTPAITQQEASPANPAAAQAAPVDDVDKLLEAEDPEFAAQMKDISDLSAEGVTVDADIESAVEQHRKEAATKGFKKIVLLLVKRPMRKIAGAKDQLVGFAKWLKEFGLPLAISGAKNGLAKTKAGIGVVVAKIKAGLAWFKALPRRSKVLLVVCVLLAVTAVAVARITLTRGIFPEMEVDYLTSFALVADHTYAIEKEEPWTDLNDPLLHPEHVVLIERLISNLKPPGDGSNPMVLIDLYVESGSQEVSIELKNRDAEARDTIGRTLLQMTYDELVTEAGKTKLKVFLRKNLNEVLTTGRVRRVYFKSIIIKP